MLIRSPVVYFSALALSPLRLPGVRVAATQGCRAFNGFGPGGKGLAADSPHTRRSRNFSMPCPLPTRDVPVSFSDAPVPRLFRNVAAKRGTYCDRPIHAPAHVSPVLFQSRRSPLVGIRSSGTHAVVGATRCDETQVRWGRKPAGGVLRVTCVPLSGLRPFDSRAGVNPGRWIAPHKTQNGGHGCDKVYKTMSNMSRLTIAIYAGICFVGLTCVALFRLADPC